MFRESYDFATRKQKAPALFECEGFNANVFSVSVQRPDADIFVKPSAELFCISIKIYQDCGESQFLIWIILTTPEAIKCESRRTSKRWKERWQLSPSYCTKRNQMIVSF